MKKIFSFLGVVLLIAAVSAGTTLAVLHLSPRGSMDVRWTSNRA